MSTGEQPSPDDLITDSWLSGAIGELDMSRENDLAGVFSYLRQAPLPGANRIPTYEEAKAFLDVYLRQVEAFLAECRRRNIPINPPPVEMRGVASAVVHKPRKGMTVLYHDPISKEACAAIVVKVHHRKKGELPTVNLVFFTEEGAYSSERKVMWGPGVMGCWWEPDGE